MQAGLPGLASVGAPCVGGTVLGGCATVLNQLGPILRPCKTLQQLLEQQACGEHLIAAQQSHGWQVRSALSSNQASNLSMPNSSATHRSSRRADCPARSAADPWRRVGINRFQGDLVSRPLPPERFSGLVFPPAIPAIGV